MLYQRLARDEKLIELLVSCFLMLIITLMLSRIFGEALMSLSDKQTTKLSQKVLLHFFHITSKTSSIIDLGSASFSDNGCSEFHQVTKGGFPLLVETARSELASTR